MFRDPAQTRAVLADYVREITNGRRALLTGTTASAGTSGIPLGSDFPGYVTDHDPQGNLDPIPAAQNRQVIIELT